MNSSSSLNKTFGRRSLSVILGTMLLFTAVMTVDAPSQTNEAGRQGLSRQLAQRWILTGVDQYSKGEFEQAEKSLLRAKEYQEYLNAEDRNKLSEVLEKTQTAKLERKHVIETYQQVAELIKQGKLEEAKAQLEQLKDNQFLRKEEKESIAEAIEKIDSQIKDKAQSQNAGDKLLLNKEESVKTKEVPEKTISATKDQQKEIADLYYRSVGLYRTGQLEKAREGFVKVIDSGLIPGIDGQDYKGLRG